MSRRDKKQLKWDEQLFLSEKIAAEPLAWFVMSEKLKKFTEKRRVQKKFSSTIRKVVNTRGLKQTLSNMVHETKETKKEKKRIKKIRERKVARAKPFDPFFDFGSDKQSVSVSEDEEPQSQKIQSSNSQVQSQQQVSAGPNQDE